MPNLGNKAQADNSKKHSAEPIDAFTALCTARAYRYATGELHLHDAVDFLQDWAVTHRLVEAIGQDAVQWIITKQFLPYRDDLNG